MRNLECDHGGHGLEAPSNKLRGICDEMRVKAVHSTNIPAIILHEIDKSAEDWDVCEQLNLAWAI